MGLEVILNHYHMKKTNSTIFLVPTLKIGREVLIENGFLNAYIGDSTSNIIYEDSLYLLFKPEFPVRFGTYINREHKRTKSIIAEYDKKLGLSVVIYKLNDNYKADIELIKASKYSKTSKEFQDLFSKTVDIERDGRLIKEVSLQYRVFNKTPELIQYWKENNIGHSAEKEIWYDFDEKAEIINQNILNEAALTKWD